MIRIVSVMILSALAQSSLASLGDTRAKIEAKYGQGIDDTEGVCYPSSVEDTNGKILKRPEPYSLTYRDLGRNIKVLVHFNSKGVATDVEYWTDGEFTNDNLRYFMQINGFANQTKLSDYPGWSGGERLYPLDDKGNSISVTWGSGLDARIDRLTGEKAITKPSMIHFRRAESLVDQFVTTRKQRDEFKKAVQSCPNLDEEVRERLKVWSPPI